MDRNNKLLMTALFTALASFASGISSALFSDYDVLKNLAEFLIFNFFILGIVSIATAVAYFEGLK